MRERKRQTETETDREKKGPKEMDVVREEKDEMKKDKQM